MTMANVLGMAMALLLSAGGSLYAQEITVSAYIQLNSGKANQGVVWIAMKNESPRPLIACREATVTSFVPIDPTQPAFGDSKVDPGCGTEGFDPWWILKPGESRTESYGIDRSPDPDVAMFVAVDLLVKTRPDADPESVHAESKRTVKEALDAWIVMWGRPR